jgi:hypothetical protein
MSNVLDQLQYAALSLAGCGSIKDRLAYAYREHLSVIESDELPEHVGDDFRELQQALHRERPLCRTEDAVHASVRKLSNKEATELAYRIVRLFGEVSRQSAASRMQAQVVPLFAAEG